MPVCVLGSLPRAELDGVSATEGAGGTVESLWILVFCSMLPTFIIITIIGGSQGGETDKMDHGLRSKRLVRIAESIHSSIHLNY